MITNFEAHTPPITENEIKIAELVKSILKTRTESNPIFSEQLQADVNYLNTTGTNITSARLRTIIHYLRVREKLPIIGTSRGYYISNDIAEIQKQRRSLMERAMSIIEVAQSFDEMEQNLLFDGLKIAEQ